MHRAFICAGTRPASCPVAHILSSAVPVFRSPPPSSIPVRRLLSSHAACWLSPRSAAARTRLMAPEVSPSARHPAQGLSCTVQIFSYSPASRRVWRPIGLDPTEPGTDPLPAYTCHLRRDPPTPTTPCSRPSQGVWLPPSAISRACRRELAPTRLRCARFHICLADSWDAAESITALACRPDPRLHARPPLPVALARCSSSHLLAAAHRRPHFPWRFFRDHGAARALALFCRPSARDSPGAFSTPARPPLLPQRPAETCVCCILHPA